MNAMTIDLGLLLSAAGTILTLGGAWALVKYQSAEATRRVEELGRDLASHKLDVAQKYVSIDHLSRSEERMMASMEKVVERLDRLTERIDRIFATKAPRQV